MNIYILAFYSLTVIVGSAINPSISNYQHVITSSVFERTLNHMLVSPFGYFLFTVAYFGYIASLKSTKPMKKYLVTYVANTLALCGLVMWLFGPLVFDRFNKLSGGNCTNPDLSQFACQQTPDWIDGFDTSGHTYMIIVMTFMLMEIYLENRDFTKKKGSLHQDDVEENQARAEASSMRVANFVNSQTDILDYITYLLIVLWYSMLLITALFFHQFWEKVAGFAISTSIVLGIKQATKTWV